MDLFQNLSDKQIEAVKTIDEDLEEINFWDLFIGEFFDLIVGKM